MKKPRFDFFFSWYNCLLDTLFPISCCICSKTGQWLCKACRDKLEYNQSLYCLHCYKETELGEFCMAVKNKWALEGVIIAGNYKDKNLKKIIKIYKYKSIKDLHTDLFDYLRIFIEKNKPAKNFFKNLSSNNTLLIPVPLHRKKQATRGFNQAQILSDKLARQYKIATDTKNLCRRKNNIAQAKLKGRKRRDNLKNNFYWQGSNLKHKNILLFDDICTTGTTLNECALTLKKAGAKKIWGITLAKG